MDSSPGEWVQNLIGPPVASLPWILRPMRFRHFISTLLLLLPLGAGTAMGGPDASRGAKLLTGRQCLRCHDFDKNLGRAATGPLAKLRKTQLKPAQLVGAMWSHLNTMWGAVGDKSPVLEGWTEEEAADLMAWFAAAGYFEPAGDSRKGSLLFNSQGCAACHPFTAPAKAPNGEIVPVDQWNNLYDPIGLLHAIWRHAPSMKAALDRKTMNWPSMSVPEFADVLAFVYSRKPSNGTPVQLALGDPEKGKAIFSMKGCVSCHSRMPASREAGLLHSFTELTAVFWNHAPMMTSLPASLNRDEIADVVAYLWKARYFEDSGNVVRGRGVFERKRCINCHNEAKSVAKPSAAAMLVAAWKHAPGALKQAREKGIAWARFEGAEMSDLLAYLSSLVR